MAKTRRSSAIGGSEKLVSGYSGRISICLASGWLATLFGRQAISPLLPAIIDDLSIGPSEAGLALTIMMGLYAIVQFPGGRYSDQTSRTTVITIGLGVLAFGFLLLATVVETYFGFLVSVATVGIGAGLFFSPSRAFLSDLFVEKRGGALGLQTAAGMLGGVLAAISAATVLTIANWRAAFVLPIVLIVLVLLALAWWSREEYSVNWVNPVVFQTVTRLIGSRQVRFLLASYIFFGLTLQSFIGFLPTFLQVDKGVSATLASGGFALFYLVGIVVGPMAGQVSDWYPRRWVIGGALALGSLGLGILITARTPFLLGTGITLTSVGLWSFIPSTQAYILDILPSHSTGGDFGFLKAIYSGLGSLGPYYVGLVAERATYTTAFVGLIGFLLLSLAIMVAETRDH